jgi:hypothetical protein
MTLFQPIFASNPSLELCRRISAKDNIFLRPMVGKEFGKTETGRNLFRPWFSLALGCFHCFPVLQFTEAL